MVALWILIGFLFLKTHHEDSSLLFEFTCYHPALYVVSWVPSSLFNSQPSCLEQDSLIGYVD